MYKISKLTNNVFRAPLRGTLQLLNLSFVLRRINLYNLRSEVVKGIKPTTRIKATFYNDATAPLTAQSKILGSLVSSSPHASVIVCLFVPSEKRRPLHSGPHRQRVGVSRHNQTNGSTFFLAFFAKLLFSPFNVFANIFFHNRLLIAKTNKRTAEILI